MEQDSRMFLYNSVMTHLIYDGEDMIHPRSMRLQYTMRFLKRTIFNGICSDFLAQQVYHFQNKRDLWPAYFFSCAPKANQGCFRWNEDAFHHG